MFSGRIGIVVLILLMASCSKYSKLLKSKDLALKHEMAIKYYEEEEYYKAMPLFEELIAIYRGTGKAEKLYYYYAFCHYHLDDYVLASHRFKEFAKRFPNSQYAEECLFMSAYCFYLNSPKPSLDQTNTHNAIKQLQLFINQYPKSVRLDSCNVLMDNLRFKLEKKAFDMSYQYYHMRNYKSAIISFDNTIKDFPDSEYREECFFLKLKSTYLLAINSVDEKKEKRLEETLEAYRKFNERFADSEQLEEASSILKKAKKQKEELAYTLSKFYYENSQYARAITNCEDALKNYPNLKNKDEIRFMIISSNYLLAMNGDISLRKQRLQNTIKAYDKHKIDFASVRFVTDADLLYNNANSELQKLPMTIPMWYYDKSNYEKAIVEFNKSLENSKEAINKNKVMFMILNSYYHHAEKSALKYKKERYEQTVKYFNSVKEKLEDTDFQKDADKINKDAQKKMNKLPTDVPISSYYEGSYENAIETFASTLESYPDFDQADRFRYLIIKSHYKRAVKATPSKQRELFSIAITAYNDLQASIEAKKITSPHPLQVPETIG